MTLLKNYGRLTTERSFLPHHRRETQLRSIAIGDLKHRFSTLRNPKRARSSLSEATVLINQMERRVRNSAPLQQIFLAPGERIKSISFWINAFIPNTLSFTKRVPAGRHAGKTGFIFPTITSLSEFFLDDQRSFSNDPRNIFNSRLSALVNFQIAPQTITTAGRTGGTISLNSKTGAILCSSKPNAEAEEIQSLQFKVKPGSVKNIITPGDGFTRLLTLEIDAFGNNHCVPGSPNIDFQGELGIGVRRSAKSDGAIISFSGFVDAFPAFEGYLKINNKPAVPLFRVNPAPGKNPLNLIGDANVPVGGAAFIIPAIRN